MPDGTSRAMVTYGEATFPLPLRDPRRQTQVTVVQALRDLFVDVPPAAPASGGAGRRA